MVNAVSMVELARLRQTTAPPAKVIRFEHIPAVSREPPVLAAVTEHVRRCACTVRKRKILAVKPYVRAVFVDEDRHIAFQAEPEFGNLVHGSGKLAFGRILHPSLEQSVPVIFHPKLIDIGGGGILVFFPVLPASLVVLCLERAIDAIGLDPCILIDPSDEFLGRFEGIVTGIKNFAKNRAFPSDNTIIIYTFKARELFASFVNFIFKIGGPFNRLDVDKNRIQGKCATGTVRAWLGTCIVYG